MGILQIKQVEVGEVGALPITIKMVTTDNLATVTTAGYLNNSQLLGVTISPNDILEVLYSYNVSTNAGSFAIFVPTISNGIITLNMFVNPGDVLLPVVSGNFAVFNGTTGQIKDAGFLPSNAAKTNVVMANGATVVNHIMVSTDTAGTVGNLAGTAINDGSIQAGRDAVAGTLISFPATTANGSLIVAAINAGGAFNTTISNSVMGQSSVISIPDPGAATGKFIISSIAGAGVQHITSGSLQVDAGGLLAGLAAGGTAGSLTLYPATASNGSLVLSPVANVGNFAATISNVTGLGQASVYTLPDPANAIARILVGATATPFTTGHILASSGTGGLVADSGIATVNVQTSALSSPDNISDLIWYDVTATAAALATAGKVNIQLSSGSKQYKLRDVKMNYAAAGLSGGGGDRLLSIADGTTVYNNAGITAALLGTPVNTLWGGTGNPLAGTVAQNTSTAAGANLYFQYIGGTTDYTTGQVIISVLVQRVA